MSTPHICLTPKVHGVGGMVSFRYKMSAGLENRGYRVTHGLDDGLYDAVLVIGGTRDLRGLRRARRRGIRIVQRLNGMNWLHRKTPTPTKGWLRAEANNWLLNIIRTRFADHIVYQSEFAKEWWERVYGKAPVPHSIVHNGVDTTTYTPNGPHQRPMDRLRVLLVEGSLAGGYELGLGTAVALAESMDAAHPMPVELTVVGKVSTALQTEWDQRARVPIRWAGLLPRKEIPAIDRSAHLLYSADLNAACPNSAIEAMSCGLPVLAFNTGALPELVSPQAGRVVAYGGDPWQLDPPDTKALAHAGMEIIEQGDSLRATARTWAQENFSLDNMVQRYLTTLQ